MVGIVALTLFMIWLVIFKNLRDPISFSSTLALATLCILQISPAEIAGGFESSKGQIISLLTLDTKLVVPLNYGCSAFRGEPGLTVWFFLQFFFCIKLSILGKINSETGATLLEAVCLKKVERIASVI